MSLIVGHLVIMARTFPVGGIARFGATLLRPRAAVARPSETTAPPVATARSVPIASVWRDALATFSAHSGSMLLCAILGFAAPVIIGQWIATQAVLKDYGWVGPAVTLYAKPSLALLIAQAVVAVLVAAFARGAITWLALSSTGTDICAAIRATLARFPTILFSALVYSFVASACVFGMSEWTAQIVDDPDSPRVSHAWAGPARAYDAISRKLLWQGINAIIQHPDALLSETTSALRAALATPSVTLTPYEHSLQATYGERAVVRPIHIIDGKTQLLTILSLVIAILLETLLRFRTVMAFDPLRSLQVAETTSGGKRPRRLAAFAPVVASARFGLRHFGVITLHIWVTRLVIAALVIAMVEFPMAVVDNFVLPNATQFVGSLPVLPLMKFAQVSAAALLGAVVLAFGAVYDARLAMWLQVNQSTR